MFDSIPVDSLKDGMRVGRDVLQGGAMLVQAGALLSDAIIGVLKKRGVEEVIIDFGHETQTRTYSEMATRSITADRDLGLRATERLNRVMTVLKQQFRGLEEDAVMAPLLMSASRFWRARIAEEYARTS